MFKNFTIYNEKEADDLFKKCITLPIEFREYMRFGKMVNVPRGQIAVSSKSEYKYTQAGGTPTILKFEDYPFLQDVLDDVNKKFDIPFNTMLINHYRDGNDYISNHSDSVVGWNKKYGFSTLALGDGERTFRIKKIDTKISRRHKIAERYNKLLSGLPLKLPYQSIDGYSAYHLYIIRSIVIG